MLVKKLLYYRSLIVGFIATVIDSGTFLILGKLHVKDNTNFIISFLLGLLIQFFGQKYWTFKNKSQSLGVLVKQIIIFFAFEIIVFALVLWIFNRIYGLIEKKISDLKVSYAKDHFKRYFVEEEKKKLVLTPFGKLFLKTIIVFFIFNLITYPVWRYVLFK